MFRAGDQIGRYTLINKLGKGAFGVVWLAERRTQITTTNAAVKIPLDDDIDIETIKHEADLWVRASGHPNVLPIIEADIYDDQIIIASEYAPDGSLESWLKKNGGKAPTIELAIEIVSGILAGLEHLHSRNIIHRDLKPANILFQGNTPRLADFGISRLLKSTSQSTNIMGTPLYMAPEAFDGKRNERTDIWSVGVIFYQLLAGRLPFDGQDYTSLIGAIMMRNPDPLPANVPKYLQNVIARALSKDTNQRFLSAAEMRKALLKPQETTVASTIEEETYTIPAAVKNFSPQSLETPTLKQDNKHHYVYAATGLIAVLIVVIAYVVISSSNNNEVSALGSPTPKATSSSETSYSSSENITKNSKTPVPRPTTFSTQIRIPADEMWVDTGISLVKGAKLNIRASGQWSDGGQPLRFWGADGTGKTWAGTIVASANLDALVGKVGNTTFSVGENYFGYSPASGKLYLSMNDTPNSFAGNEGEMNVQISYESNGN